VVICCDGLEWGSPQQLASEVARLRRRSRRIIWVNPRAANPLVERYPNPFITAVRSHVDGFDSGHNLASLEEVAELLRKPV